MEINSTIIFKKNWSALQEKGVRFVINEGGSRSSKTYSLCQMVIVYCLQNPNKVVSIIRKTFPALRATVMRDFLEILKDLDIYEKTNHNMSENIYRFPNGSIVEFFSVDDEQKIRGRKRDIAWCNEANELFYDDFTQLNMRTETKLIFDYNPSDSSSWLYELPKDESILIKSTYKDNPFLPETIKRQIEDLKRTDEALYQIYALGEKAISKSNIYSNLTTSNLIEKMKILNVEENVEILADYSRPEIIQEMNNSGFNVLNANKVVKKGIDNVKSFGVFCEEDQRIKKEYENYKWKKIGDNITDEPIKLYDDAMDAVRYATTYIKENYYTDDSYIAF